MGLYINVILLILVGVSAYQIHNILFAIPPLPKLDDTWWGSEISGKEDSSIKPFEIKISEDIIQDLQKRLQQARPFKQPLEGIQHEYGINTKLLKGIVEFWKTNYNWRQREKFLNQFSQFTTNIQGLKIHYLHVKPKNVGKNIKVLPLLLLHGWPGSVREFYEIIPILTTPQKEYDFVFEVIAPSLPGYGFSEGAVKPGLGAAQMAVVFKNLMQRLGFEKYYVQGGDWGGIIVRYISQLFPNRVLGLHSNMCYANSLFSNIKTFIFDSYPGLFASEEFINKTNYSNHESLFTRVMLESGYMHLHATKPDTIGVALNDSPVGLAAYILEKFITWTNTDWRSGYDGGLKDKFTYTKLLDNIMIYWVTNSITTSIRLYSETFNKAHAALMLDSIPVKVPSACAIFRKELIITPVSILKDHYENMLHDSICEGGHFAAFEQPRILADDINKAVEKFENFNRIK